MNETKLVVWQLGPATLPPDGEIKVHDIDLAAGSDATGRLVDYLGDGWTPVSHNVTPLGWPMGAMILSILFTRPVVAPADPEGLT